VRGGICISYLRVTWFVSCLVDRSVPLLCVCKLTLRWCLTIWHQHFLSTSHSSHHCQIIFHVMLYNQSSWWSIITLIMKHLCKEKKVCILCNKMKYIIIYVRNVEYIRNVYLFIPHSVLSLRTFLNIMQMCGSYNNCEAGSTLQNEIQYYSP